MIQGMLVGLFMGFGLGMAVALYILTKDDKQ